MDERLLRPLTEASYLTAGNAWRYRSILRHFYLQHESMRHLLYPEEVLRELANDQHFAQYGENELEQDLGQLVEWGNLVARQDTRRVASVEEFRKKRFRYQATAYTIEIERMVIHLEQMGSSFGGSLERTDVDRLLETLQRFLGLGSEASAEELQGRWTDLFEAFRRLTTNATNYLAYLSSERSEALMNVDAFLVYKDSLGDYLRNFVSALQRTAVKIEPLLAGVDQARRDAICERLTDYALAIPRLDERPAREDLQSRYQRQWDNLHCWFLGEPGRSSDRYQLQLETHEAIRRITRFVQRLGERHQQQRSRRQEYLQLAQRFAACPALADAHILSASVFGLMDTRHFYAPGRDTEDIYAETWDRPALALPLEPRVRTYRQKSRSTAILDRTAEKTEQLASYLQEQNAEAAILQQLAKQGSLRVADLGVVEPVLRKTLLGWIARALASGERIGSTESGRRFRLQVQPGQIWLHACDGSLLMPDYSLEFWE